MKSHFNKLEEIDRTRNPFKVPDNYFARFNEEMMNHLPEKEIVTPKTVPLWDKVKPWVYMAAMFVGLYITIQFLTRQPDNGNIASRQSVVQTKEGYWSTVQVTEEEFYQYLEEQLVEEGYFDYMYDQYYLN
jgi:hypothetical protein